MAQASTSGEDPPEQERAGEGRGDEEVGVCRVSLNGEVLGANDVMARLLGLSAADQLVGRYTTDFYRDLNDREELIRELLSRKSVKGVEVEIRKADGEPTTLVQSCELREDAASGRTVIEKRVAPPSRASEILEGGADEEE